MEYIFDTYTLILLLHIFYKKPTQKNEQNKYTIGNLIKSHQTTYKGKE